jgi:hypothetical protein
MMESTNLDQIVLAAIGIDLLTARGVTKDSLAQQFGPQVASWIAQLWNQHGTRGHAAYLATIAEAEEEVWLIKTAALAEDLLGVAYGTHDLGPRWIKASFVPMSRETRVALSELQYQRYPVTGAFLAEVVDGAWDRFQAALRSADGQEWAQGAGVRRA